jgi:hypothetical protein
MLTPALAVMCASANLLLNLKLQYGIVVGLAWLEWLSVLTDVASSGDFLRGFLSKTARCIMM